MNSVKEFLQACPAYYIATMDGDQPRVRPFSSLCVYEDRLYIESNYFKPFANQVKASPKVEICAFDGVSRWLRITCELVDDSRYETRKALLEQMPHIRDLGYDENDEGMSMYWMKDAVATFSSYTEEPYEVRF